MGESRHLDWLKQAEVDRGWMLHSLDGGYHSGACFIAQQVAEKSLKALAFSRGAQTVKSHSVLQIAHELKINSEIEKAGRILDRYYISGRYPDAYPAGIPEDFFDKEIAIEAVEAAEIVYNYCRKIAEK